MSANSTEQPRRKPTPGSWTPGRSGNPKGRPGRASSLTDAIRSKVDPNELLEIALTIARTSEDEKTRLAAIQWLRDSGFTKPAEKHEHAMGAPDEDEDLDIDALTIDQIRELHTAELEFDARRNAIVNAPGAVPMLLTAKVMK